MNNAFITILNLSLSGGCVALIVMILRLFLKKAPKKYSYALWAVVFVRLICPFTIELPVKTVPIRPQSISGDIVSSPNPSIQSGVSTIDTVVNTVLDRTLPPVHAGASINPIQVWLAVGEFLWCIGILSLLLYGVLSYVRLYRRVSTAIRIRDNIFETDHITTPFVLGLVNPKIYIPIGLSEKELEFIILHEQTHIKRYDYLIKPFAFIIVAFHWFNPLVWVSYYLLAKDIELSADEYVMKQSMADIRGEYSITLLSLSAKKSGLLSPLAFGETGVKERIRNVLKYKKPTFWISVITIVVILTASVFLMSSMKERPENELPTSTILPTTGSNIDNSNLPSDTPTSKPLTKEITYESVKITLFPDFLVEGVVTEFETTDRATVSNIASSIELSVTPSDETDLYNNNSMRYQIGLSKDNGGYSCLLYYNTLDDKAYIEKDGGLYEVDTDFARYIASFLENANITFHMKEEVVTLFAEYGWTLDYQIYAMNNKLNEIRTLSAFNPNAYYFAYNNELSKEIGLDMSDYSNSTNLDVEIYRIRERMPLEFYPARDARAIVVKNGNEIIGAFISSGRHSAFTACSLKGNRFEEVTGLAINQWITNMVTADQTESELSQLEPEKVIEEYFKALNQKDERTALYCMWKGSLLEKLTANMPNEGLFMESSYLPLSGSNWGAKSVFDNLKSVKLIEVKLLDGTKSSSLTYRVSMDIQYKQDDTITSGEQNWDCTMVFESPQTGWKIVGFGH
ncbi:MAG: peptidase BlaR1 [Herbinix sp.]|nr:peptidase BlaR1 [Herbinix sp.]